MASTSCSSAPSTATLLEWAKEIAFLKGYWQPAPSFDPMLFCGNLDWDRAAAPLEPVPTPKTELRRFAWDEHVWRNREAYLTHPNFKGLQDNVHAELDRQLHAKGVSIEQIQELTRGDVFRKVAEVEARNKRGKAPWEEGANAQSVAEAFGYHTTSNAKGPGPRIKLVLGTRYPDGTAHSKLVERQLWPDDDWGDAQRLFEQEAKAAWTTVDSDWWYGIEGKKSGMVDGHMFRLASRRDWESLRHALKGRHRGKAALVFQESWKNAIHHGDVIIGSSSSTVKQKEEEEVKWDRDIVDADGNPVFRELTMEYLMSNSSDTKGKEGPSTQELFEGVKLPLKMSDEWKAMQLAQDDLDSQAAFDMALYLEAEWMRTEEDRTKVEGQHVTPASEPNLLEASALITPQRAASSADDAGMRLRSGRRKPTTSPSPGRGRRRQAPPLMEKTRN